MCVSSTMLQAGAQIMQGISDSNTAKANAKMAIAEGRSAYEAGKTESERIAREGERFQGSTAVAQADGGADLSSGSAALVAAESQKGIQQDVDMALYRGRLGLWQGQAKAKILKKQGQAALVNSGLNAYATIMGGVAKAASMGAAG